MLTLKNTSAIVAWEVHRGDDWAFPVVKTNTPVTMAGWTWLGQIRASRGRASTLIATLDVDTSAAATGTVTFSLPAVTTDEIEAGSYFYEIEKTTTDGVVTTLVGGPLLVVDDTSAVV